MSSAPQRRRASARLGRAEARPSVSSATIRKTLFTDIGGDVPNSSLGPEENIRWVIRVISGSWLFLLFQKLSSDDEGDMGECLREISE